MNYKKLLLIMVSIFSIVGLLTGSVAYYRTTYEGKLIASTGNVVFNVTGLSDDGVNKTIDLGSMLLPGDSGLTISETDSSTSTTTEKALYNLYIDSALTDDNAYAIINYVSGTETIAQGMKSTAASANQSKITLKQI